VGCCKAEVYEVTDLNGIKIKRGKDKKIRPRSESLSLPSEVAGRVSKAKINSINPDLYDLSQQFFLDESI
jgi:hypothetical protein